MKAHALVPCVVGSGDGCSQLLAATEEGKESLHGEVSRSARVNINNVFSLENKILKYAVRRRRRGSESCRGEVNTGVWICSVFMLKPHSLNVSLLYSEDVHFNNLI